MAQPTPGPWSAFHLTVCDDHGQQIAIMERGVKDPDSYLAEDKANAALMAAAPALLDACRFALLACPPDLPGVRSRLERAVKKAESA